MMTDSDTAMRKALRHGQAAAEQGRIRAFDDLWAAAEQRAARSRQRHRAGAITAAVAILAVVTVGVLLPRGSEWLYVDPDEIVSKTSWVAPSDALLPKQQFDIYEEIPVLIESTGANGGTLL